MDCLINYSQSFYIILFLPFPQSCSALVSSVPNIHESTELIADHFLYFLTCVAGLLSWLFCMISRFCTETKSILQQAGTLISCSSDHEFHKCHSRITSIMLSHHLGHHTCPKISTVTLNLQLIQIIKPLACIAMPESCMSILQGIEYIWICLWSYNWCMWTVPVQFNCIKI